MTIKNLLLRLGAFATLLTTATGASAQVALWLQNYGGVSSETVVDIVTDASGNIFTVGTTGNDVLVVSYTSAGVFRWANTYAGPGGGIDRPVEAIVDGSSNVILVGEGSQSPTLGAFMALKFNGATGGLMWSKLYYENDPIFGDVSGPARGVCIGPGGFIYACGAIEVFNEFYDALTVRFSPTTGAVVGTATYGLPAASNQIAEDIAWDGAGSIYVTGSTADNQSPYSPDGSDIMLAKYNGSLGNIWVKTFDGYGKADYGRSVVCRNALNAVYVLGSTTTDPASYPELATLRVNSISGAQVWRRTRATASDIHSGKMVLDSLGYLTVLARLDMLSSTVIRYRSTDGSLVWERFRDGQFNDLVTDGSSNTIIVGEGTAKLGADGGWRWEHPEPAAACAVSPTNIVYTGGAPAADMRTIRWYQASFGLSLTPNSTPGGYIVTGTVYSSSTAPFGGLPFNISETSPYVNAPASATIPAGSTIRNFSIPTLAIPGMSNIIVTITASCYGATTSNTLTLVPPSLLSVSVTPDSVTGGVTALGKVTLTGIAPAGGKFVTLSDNNAACAVPSGALVGTGNASRTFNVTTSAVVAETGVVITATLDGVVRTATLTISP